MASNICFFQFCIYSWAKRVWVCVCEHHCFESKGTHCSCSNLSCFSGPCSMHTHGMIQNYYIAHLHQQSQFFITPCDLLKMSWKHSETWECFVCMMQKIWGVASWFLPQQNKRLSINRQNFYNLVSNICMFLDLWSSQMILTEQV